MKLYEFCEKFIAHNTVVCLVQEIIKKKEEGVKQHEYNKIWQGMDWQIVQGAGDEDYFKAHPDVEKCPFKNYNVAKVIGNIFNAFPETADYITIVIGFSYNNLYPLETDKDKEISRLKAENSELRERLDKAIEPPVKIGDKKYMPDCDGTMVLEETVIGVRLSYDNICGVCVDCVETRTQRGAVERFTYPQWQTLLYDTREAAEARLKELQEGKK